MTYTVGLIGYGRIGTDLAERARADPEFELEYVYVRSEKEELPADLQIPQGAGVAVFAV